ncbi:exodeoxyribonuclease V subunit beta [Methylobacterium sp. R2-1]|uniref:UvrD-helicase domain-containing protein n=1 Tax=Methylobacterium sp. R2-1 TaxID=2587064 RepID=UPI00160F335A|nr:UvrD-helicase domain-containing protein [Methylobacterium sp. R2-1]MBB2961884.1 ATP-dependent exoDNAse (exonuclease V) beta subunit [Methylobacterium sp. R2-1]
MTQSRPLNRVDTTLASAGTGKTTALVRQITEAIASGVAPERIVATTFTLKSAEELMERARGRLVADGMAEQAGRLLGARVGTVNAICGQLVSEFAFEVGRSPAGEIIPEESVRATFAMAADRTIAVHAPRLNALAEAFGLAGGRVDWRNEVLRIVELARAYGIDTDHLNASAERSAVTFMELLPPASNRSEAELDAALGAAAREAVASIAATPLRAASLDAAEAAREAVRRSDRGEIMPWPLWAKLADPRAAREDARLFDGLASIASAHSSHPRLRRQAAELIEGTFACAAQALTAYQAYKASHGLMDFTDQEALALEILRRPDTQARLRERIEMVLVDEVQDSSPLQVAIFTELARIACRSVWVGDPKQAIYGFRDTDAALTLAACREAAAATGGNCGFLSRSWRSRPGLCAFVNDAFSPAFEAMGLPASGTRFSGCTRDDIGLPTEAVAVWSVIGRNRCERAAGLAGGIAAALADAGAWRVRGRNGGRDLRAGDVAVLCRGNAEVELVASALAALQVPVAVERGDLLATPEVELSMAALRWVADADDHLALAEMARLLGGAAATSDWLAAVAEDDPTALRALVPFASVLEDLRAGHATMTPCEVVDALIMATGIVDIVCRWGDARARLRHLEAFREVPRSYERECSRLSSAATVAGLITWVAGRTLMCPRSLDPDAVQVMTYHRAKGLEWPMVIMTELERRASPRTFGVCVESEPPVDWRDPLASRWLRFWPWPYGRQTRGLLLDAAARASEPGRRAAATAREEALRLLYVGATRARDHLVFVRQGSRPANWLSVLDTTDRPHLSLPDRDGDPIRAGFRRHPARRLTVRAVARPAASAPEVPFLAPERARRRLRPLRVRPSAATSAAHYTVVATHELGGRVKAGGEASPDLLGQAVHAFLAADLIGANPAARRQRARMVVERWSVAGSLCPDGLVSAADRLWTFLADRFPQANIRREVPVHAELGGRVIAGRVDVLVDDGRRFAVIDHKSLPDLQGLWERKAAGYGSQLRLYSCAVTRTTGMECIGLFVHLPFAGAILELRCGTAARTAGLHRGASAYGRRRGAVP